MNAFDDCINHKFSGSKHISSFICRWYTAFQLRYRLIAGNQEISSKEIRDERSWGCLFCIRHINTPGSLSLYTWVIQKRYKSSYDIWMQDCKPGDTPVVKETSSVSINDPKNDFEVKETEDSLCVSRREFDVCSVCMRPVIAYIIRMLGRYLSIPRMDNWKAAKRVMRYLQRIKDYMFTYKRSDQLEIIGYSDSNCWMPRQSEIQVELYLLASWRSYSLEEC